MSMRRLLAAFVLVLWSSTALAAPSAPAFTLARLDGGSAFDSRAYLGKKVLLVRFQASWCKVCAQEAAGIERLSQKYRRSVEVVGVQVDDTEADARRFLSASTYPAGLDPALRIANRFKAKGTPYTVIIDKRGEIVSRIAGRADEARLARVLDGLLKEPPKKKPPSRLQ
jgi:cytochrome c biogenesis protein CcmG, thiol:disulfide interchange protein DsbE